MEFGLFYEIPVPRPWTRARRARRLPRRHRAGGARRGGRLHALLDRRASLPRRVLALLGARGAVRRGGGAKTSRIKIGHGVRLLPFPYNHPMRVAEMAATLDFVSRRPPRVRHRPLVDARRARGLRHRPAATRATCGRRRSTSWSARGRTTSSSGRAATSRCRRAACTRSRSSSRIRRSGWRRPARRATRSPAGKGLGLLSFTIGVPPEELAARIAALPRRARRRRSRSGKFVNSRAATFTMVHCAETNAEAQRERRRVGACGTSARASS